MNATFSSVWAWVRWGFVGILALFVIAAVYFVYQGRNVVLTQRAVAKIHATRLTHEDVYGPLPAAPDQAANNATLVGVDANQNGIRDDVEIAIYNAHKDSATTTAAMLQYAKELQLEFTDVFNSPTLVAVMQEESRGSLCISDLTQKQEVRTLVFNTQARSSYSEDIRSKYMIGYELSNVTACDISV